MKYKKQIIFCIIYSILFPIFAFLVSNLVNSCNIMEQLLFIIGVYIIAFIYGFWFGKKILTPLNRRFLSDKALYFWRIIYLAILLLSSIIYYFLFYCNFLQFIFFIIIISSNPYVGIKSGKNN